MMISELQKNIKYLIIFVFSVFLLGMLIGIEIDIYRNSDDVSWEMVIGLSSLLIALLAFFQTILQSYETIKFNKSTVRPHLTTWTHSDYNKMRFELFIRNNGLGPAIINKFEYRVEGIAIEGDGTDNVKNLFKHLLPNIIYKYTPAFISYGYALKVNDDIRLFDIEFNGKEKPSEQFIDEQGDKIDIYIEFESMYGEKLIFDTSVIKHKLFDIPKPPILKA